MQVASEAGPAGIVNSAKLMAIQVILQCVAARVCLFLLAGIAYVRGKLRLIEHIKKEDESERMRSSQIFELYFPPWQGRTPPITMIPEQLLWHFLRRDRSALGSVFRLS